MLVQAILMGRPLQWATGGQCCRGLLGDGVDQVSDLSHCKGEDTEGIYFIY